MWRNGVLQEDTAQEFETFQYYWIGVCLYENKTEGLNGEVKT